MDPITLITTALVLGITAGAKPVAEQAIKDTYNGLKTLIVDKYKLHLAALESKPDSEIQRAAIAEQLVDAQVDKDNQVIEIAEQLIELGKQQKETNEQLEKIQVNLKNNKKFAFSVTGNATYTEK